MLVSGHLLAAQGRLADAKQRLARSLKLAHGSLGNQQLVAQVHLA